MLVLTTTNEMICDDHGMWSCENCTITEVAYEPSVVEGVIDLRGNAAQTDLVADVVDLTGRRAAARPGRMPLAA